MDHISLLPVEFKKQKRSNRKFNISTMIMMITLGIVIFSYVIIKIMSTIPAAEHNALNAENQMLLGDTQRVKTYSELTDDLHKLGSLAQEAMARQPDWMQLFEALNADIPEGLQITAIDTKQEDGISTLTLSGNARNHEMVALWLEKLKQQEIVDTVKLQYLQTVELLEQTSVQFEFYLTVAEEFSFKLFEEVEP